MESSSKENTQFFSKSMILSIDRSSSRTEPSTSKEKRTLCGGIKVPYLKSTITQIERRFDIPSSLVGLIDGSFEIGNLLIIILVSYFGAKLHRPKIIGAGYEVFSSSSNSTISVSPCLQDRNQVRVSGLERSQTKIQTGCVQTVAILGPILGFLLGSLCAKLYVDIGFVDMGTVAITHKDPHWVGAWWLGYLIAGMVSILAAIPFWFLPKHLPRPEIRKDSTEQSRFITEGNKDCCATYQTHFNFFKMAKEFLPSLKSLLGNPVYFLYLCSSIIQFNSLIGMVTYKPKYIEQQFGQSSSKTNFIIGMVEVLEAGIEAVVPKNKFITVFICFLWMVGTLGLINIPAVALGMFSGSLFMKKFRLNMLGAAKLSLISSFLGYLLLLTLFTTGCKNAEVAGLTISYEGYFMTVAVWAFQRLPQGLLQLSWVLVHKERNAPKSGIPAPVYFGVSLDTTCLRWGSKRCGGQGACRLYDSNAFRYIYLGLTIVLGTVSAILSIAVLIVLKKTSAPPPNETPAISREREATSVFIAALAFSYFSKTFAGTTMKSSFTQLERRFGIASSTTGFIDGGFEMDCDHKIVTSYAWIFVLLGNLLRGIGESPITPLGISYLDDFSREEDVPLYISFLHTSAMLGPLCGFLLGSVFARLYVDVGFVDMDTITISPTDSRWVGAWWMNFLVAGVITLISGIPFLFLPKSLDKKEDACIQKNLDPMESNIENSHGQKLDIQGGMADSGQLKEFFKSLKRILGNKLYLVLLCSSLLNASSFIGYITYQAKYMEQQYGLSMSRSNFITGNCCRFASGPSRDVFKWVHHEKIQARNPFCYKNGIRSIIHRICLLVSVSNAGLNTAAQNPLSLSSACNSNCTCATSQWDPVCGENGLTYMSACFAGCKNITRLKKKTVFHNCSCIEQADAALKNSSAVLGECRRSDECSKNFIFYTIKKLRKQEAEKAENGCKEGAPLNEEIKLTDTELSARRSDADMNTCL
ncbi:Solute carrier organic anion transporter family member 1B3, partial [Ophiophagus hannah]